MSRCRFAYLTDTHIGCDANGYQKQKRYLDHVAELFAELGSWLVSQEVSFVIHGGDVTDHGSPQEIEQANRLFDALALPVYVSLGNHDLMSPESMDNWRSIGRTRAGAYLPNGADCFTVDAGHATIVVLTHHWHAQEEHQWLPEEGQVIRVDERQLQMLGQLMHEADRPVIAVTHAPINAIPARQHGGDTAIHTPEDSYIAAWQHVAQTNPNMKLLLAGHNHVHTHHDHGSFISCTTASFIERPAQLRLITVDEKSIDVQTITLAPLFSLPAALEPATAWSVGLPETQSFSIPIG